MSGTSRRALLQGAALTALAGVAVRPASAGKPARLAFVDPRLSEAERAAALPLLDVETELLDGDLVRHWRRDLAERVACVPAAAVTRWDQALLLRGLAREAGLRARQRRIGRGLFLTDISPDRDRRTA